MLFGCPGSKCSKTVRNKYNANRASETQAFSHCTWQVPGYPECIYTGSTPTIGITIHHSTLFLDPPLTDVCLSSWAWGAISAQSFFGSNPTKRNSAFTATEIGKCYLKNNLSYLGWKTTQAILGQSSTCQSHRIECFCPPSAMSSADFCSFSPSLHLSLLSSLPQKKLFLSEPHFHT